MTIFCFFFSFFFAAWSIVIMLSRILLLRHQLVSKLLGICGQFQVVGCFHTLNRKVLTGFKMSSLPEIHSHPTGRAWGSWTINASHAGVSWWNCAKIDHWLPSKQCEQPWLSWSLCLSIILIWRSFTFCVTPEGQWVQGWRQGGHMANMTPRT